MSEQRTKYLIIGSGAAGIHAAEAIRQRDKLGRLLIVSDEKTPAYKRPMLSKSPIRNLRQRCIELHSESWYTENSIELLVGCSVIALDTAAHRASTSAGDIVYEKCVYALGGQNFIPPFKGAGTNGVVTIHDSSDLRGLKKHAIAAEKAVIIGGGVVGIEMAAELRRYGMDVTVLEAMPRLMPRQLDEATSSLLVEMLGELHVYTGVGISEIQGDDHVTAVALDDGRVFPCGLVIISCGQRANTALAQSAGIPCGRAVIVNERMETGARDVWACGDCAELDGENPALWSQAVAQGCIAGANAAGGREAIAEYDRSLILNNGDVSLFAVGDLGGDAAKTYECVVREIDFDAFSINEKPPHAIEKRYYCDGKMTGGCIVGNLSGMERMKKEYAEERRHG